MKLLKSLLSAAAVACLAAAPLTAQAGLTLMLTSGLSTVTITDGGVGDSNVAAGAITFIGGVGLWNINVSTGLGVGLVPGQFSMDLNSVDTSLAGAAALTIALSQDYLSYGSGGLLPVTGHIGGTVGGGGTLSYDLYADSSNALFGTGGLAFSGTTSGASFGQSGGTSVLLSNPFSMTLATTLTHTYADSSSFDFKGKIPETVWNMRLG